MCKSSLSPLSSPLSQNGTAKGSFLSGFAASLLGGTIAENFGNSHTVVKVTMAAIAGGTASVIGGGKFANGAMSGAFIMLFNDLYANGVSKEVNDSTSEAFRKSHPNSFSIHAHGNQGAFYIDGIKYNNIDKIRDLLNANGWDGKQNIILFSCNTGHSTIDYPTNIASVMSNGLGVNIYAPTEYYAVPAAFSVFGVQGYVSNSWRIPSGTMQKF